MFFVHALHELTLFFLCVFFFQAEDGIRDRTVTGVQTCALPICPNRRHSHRRPRAAAPAWRARTAAGLGRRNRTWSHRAACTTKDARPGRVGGGWWMLVEDGGGWWKRRPDVRS